MTTFVIMHSDTKALFDTYKSYSYRKVAQRHADNYAAKHNCKLEVIALDAYWAAGYDKLTHKVRNMMTGEMVDENINTPYSCSVASESYWCN